jgi:hypothetical protein
MYFIFSYRTNPAKGKSDAYYRLVESYRNEKGQVCHTTLLNVGFLDDIVDREQRERIANILKQRYEIAIGNLQLFEIEPDNSPIVNELADKFCNELVSKIRIDFG